LQAKTFANKTKDVFKDPNVNMNRSGLATTGFNVTKEALIDYSKVATSHKYGKTEIQTPHPGWIVLPHLFSLTNGLVQPKLPTSTLILRSTLPIDKPTKIFRLKS
jgi:hypothetical protein